MIQPRRYLAMSYWPGHIYCHWIRYVGNDDQLHTGC